MIVEYIPISRILQQNETYMYQFIFLQLGNLLKDYRKV